MSQKENFSELSRDTVNALSTIYQKSFEQAFEEADIERPLFFLLWLAAKLSTDSVSIEDFQRYNPYNPIQRYEENLTQLAEKGFLASVSENIYRLTEKGEDIVQRFIAGAVWEPLAAAALPLPEADLERMAELLYRVVENAVAFAEVPTKYAIMQSRSTDPGTKAAVLVRLDQYATDMINYRDDAHLAAWQPLGVSGPVWEALSFLWEEQELSALKERLEVRGHPEEALKSVLQEVVQRGWAEQDGETYRITEQGKKVRQEAEEATNRYYDGPWNCLNEAETKELRDLMTQLRDSLTAENEEESA